MQQSIESQAAFMIGFFGVPIFYLLTSSGLSIEEVVSVLEIQASLWVFGTKIEHVF